MGGGGGDVVDAELARTRSEILALRRQLSGEQAAAGSSAELGEGAETSARTWHGDASRWHGVSEDTLLHVSPVCMQCGEKPAYYDEAEQRQHPCCSRTCKERRNFEAHQGASFSCFVLGLQHVTLIELRLTLLSYQDYHMLRPTAPSRAP